MTHTEVHFEGDFPEELKSTVVDLMNRFAFFVNHTVDRWYVEVHDGEGQDADVSILRRYRGANVRLTMEFFKRNERLRAGVFAHELAHSITAPMRDFAYELARSYVPEGSGYAFTEARLIEANELQTEDIARAMLMLTEPPEEDG